MAKPRYHVPKHDQTPKCDVVTERTPITFWSQQNAPQGCEMGVARSRVRAQNCGKYGVCVVERCAARSRAPWQCYASNPWCVEQASVGANNTRPERGMFSEPGRVSSRAHRCLSGAVCGAKQQQTEECNAVHVVERIDQSGVVAGEHSQGTATVSMALQAQFLARRDATAGGGGRSRYECCCTHGSCGCRFPS